MLSAHPSTRTTSTKTTGRTLCQQPQRGRNGEKIATTSRRRRRGPRGRRPYQKENCAASRRNHNKVKGDNNFIVSARPPIIYNTIFLCYIMLYCIVLYQNYYDRAPAVATWPNRRSSCVESNQIASVLRHVQTIFVARPPSTPRGHARHCSHQTSSKVIKGRQNRITSASHHVAIKQKNRIRILSHHKLYT